MITKTKNLIGDKNLEALPPRKSKDRGGKW